MSCRALLITCVCVAICVWLQASPAYAALQSAGLLDRATQHFQMSLTKWSTTMTNAAIVLFWMLATIACVWELGKLALHGASMDAALSFLVRFGFIEGLWLYLIQNAVPIGTSIIESLRRLGTTASGLPKELMPSGILDIGFALLWKTMKFVGVTGWSAPIVALVALVVTLIIVLVFALTAINMVLLIVSQWFLLYGGIFFLGFGGAAWESDKAKNYFYLTLSIGAQLMLMAAVVGIGQSFIEAQYAQLSGDTALGELVVILIVAALMFLLANEIPKLATRLVPGSHAVHGLGMASLLGGTVTAVAAFGAASAMLKGAAANIAGVVRAAGAAHSAASAQSRAQTTRAQTGIAASSGGSIAPGGGRSYGGSSPGLSAAQHQGPFGSMLSNRGIAPSASGHAERRSASIRAGTSTPAEKPITPESLSANTSLSNDDTASAPVESEATQSLAADSDDHENGSSERAASAPTDSHGPTGAAADDDAESEGNTSPDHREARDGTPTSDDGLVKSAQAAVSGDTPSGIPELARSASAEALAASSATSAGGAHAASDGPSGSPSTTGASAKTVASGTASSSATASANAPSGSTQVGASPSSLSTNGVAPTATPNANSSTDDPPPGESSAATAQGAQRGLTSVRSAGTILAAAKIFGEHALQHQRDRIRKVQEAFSAQADTSIGGQIAEAIRAKYGLETDPVDPEPVRSTTEISSDPQSLSTPEEPTDLPKSYRQHAAGHKHPADWLSGDEPMTAKQWALLEYKLGDQFDPNLTKAEAAILIDEILNDE